MSHNHSNTVPICRDCFDRIVERLRDLTNSAQEVVGSWEHGDLAGAVNVLEGDAEAAQALLDEIDASVLAKADNAMEHAP